MVAIVGYVVARWCCHDAMLAAPLRCALLAHSVCTSLELTLRYLRVFGFQQLTAAMAVIVLPVKAAVI